MFCFLENLIYDLLVLLNSMRKSLVNGLGRISKIMNDHVHKKFLLYQLAFELFDLVDVLLALVIPIFIRKSQIGKKILDITTQKYGSPDAILMKGLYGIVILLVL